MAYIKQGEIRTFPSNACKNNAHSGTVIAQDTLEKRIALAQLPEKYHPSDFDNGPYLRDETWLQFVRWRMATEEPNVIEYHPAGESVGIMIPTKAVHNPYSRKSTKIPHSIIILNPRDVGKYISLSENLKQHLADYLRSDEGILLAQELSRLGYSAEDIDYIAVGFVPEQAIYGVGKLPDGSLVVYANKDAYKLIKADAEDSGLTPEELIEVIVAEEITHIFRKSRPTIGEETATKQFLKTFYERLAKTTKDPVLLEKYLRTIRHLEHDLETISRYRDVINYVMREKNNTSNKEDNSDNPDISTLEEALIKEAIAEGYNTAEGISRYITNRLKNSGNKYSRTSEGKNKEVERSNKNSKTKTDSKEETTGEDGEEEGESSEEAEAGE